MKHALEVVSRRAPGCHGNAEEHKVLEHALGVDANHGTDPTKGRVLLLVVSDGAEGVAPHGQELGEKGGHLGGTHQTQSPDGDGRVLQ